MPEWIILKFWRRVLTALDEIETLNIARLISSNYEGDILSLSLDDDVTITIDLNGLGHVHNTQHPFGLQEPLLVYPPEEVLQKARIAQQILIRHTRHCLVLA